MSTSACILCFTDGAYANLQFPDFSCIYAPTGEPERGDTESSAACGAVCHARSAAWSNIGEHVSLCFAGSNRCWFFVHAHKASLEDCVPQAFPSSGQCLIYCYWSLQPCQLPIFVQAPLEPDC